MKKIILLFLSVGTITYACTDDRTGTQTEPVVPAGKLVSPVFVVTTADTLYTGALEVYPCEDNSTVYYGNYQGTPPALSPFPAGYIISKGAIAPVGMKPVLLPENAYDLVYWGISAPTDTANYMAVNHPPLRLNADLSKLNYTLRAFTDSTYHPVFNYVFTIKKVDIGSENISVALHRVVAGLEVTVQNEDQSKLSSSIAGIRIYVGSIAESLNFTTAEAANMTKTVEFPLTVSADSLTATNPQPVTVFPSAANPPIQIVLNMKDGTRRSYKTLLGHTLVANSMLKLTVNIGDIYSSETSGGGFQVTKWTEKHEVIDTGPIIE